MIIGYMVVGKGEADKMLEEALHDLQRLCDRMIVVLNNVSEKEDAVLRKFHKLDIMFDDDEWGKNQWKIKQRLINYALEKYEPEGFVCKDADEMFDSKFNKDELLNLFKKGDSWYFYCVNMWNDGYLPAMNFWNIRAWRNVPRIKHDMEHKALHCGLAPKWTYAWGNYAPYMFKHFGLQTPQDRAKKVARYEIYDTTAQYVSPLYYKALKSTDKAVKFDEKTIHQEIANEVQDYKLKKVKLMDNEKRFYFVKRLADGMILDIPEENLEETLARGGFELISDRNDPVVSAGTGIKTTTVKSEKIRVEEVDEPADEVVDDVKEPEVAPKDVLVCETCGFIAKSEHGLKIHSAKHK